MARVSLFIGGIRPLPQSGRPTGMYKAPVAGVVELDTEGFVGDQQADRRVHGGPEKAVHLYPARHYEKLAAQFPEAAGELCAGALGENLSTPELDERDVRIGDVWRLGTARLQVCQPRNPCWKIDERFGCDGMAAHIAEERLTGWYFRVLEAGQVSPGDTLDLIEPAPDAPTLYDAMLLWQQHRPALGALDALSRVAGIGSGWRQKIVQRLDWLRKLADTA
ncbi:MOSC domain-containing protein [Chitinivorax sp. PXF-14]|uniref:MOSC domain-containing protein n=1 Tax=Chitinivorax sp. PXF-14 TaxID=3230488 RepID=UPI003465B0E8